MNKIKLHSLVAFAVETTLKREDLADLIEGAKTDLGDFLTLRAEAVNFAVLVEPIIADFFEADAEEIAHDLLDYLV